MKSNRARATYAAALSMTAALGMFTGIVLRPQPVGACEYNVCSTSTGNCDETDVSYNCQEVSEEPGCKSTACA
jgi:hypothetical protein